MRLKSTVACAAAILFCVVATGCHTTGGYGCSDCAGPVGCDSIGGGCTTGARSGLAGLLGNCFGKGCDDGCCSAGCQSGCLGGGCTGCNQCVTPAELTADGYGAYGGVSGPLAGHLGVGKHFRGPQSHMGPAGPADGPAIGQTTYPYYTTRGPRDFFASRPASIGP